MNQPDKKARILVVDDEKSMVTSLRDVLDALGFAVDVAYSGSQAVERASRHRPDFILMDLRMPGIDGVEACREIQRLSPESRVIFMTAYASSSLVVEARSQEHAEVLFKPIEIDHVLEILDQENAETPILVVDDSSVSCQLIEALAERQIEVHRTCSVAEAVTWFESRCQGVVVLESGSGEHRVPDALLTLKRGHPRAVVLLVSQNLDPRGNTMAACADFSPPFEMRTLIQTLHAPPRRAV